MRVVVPFDPEQPKTRLGDLLTDSERYSIARAMLRDVLSRIEQAGGEPTVLATAPVGIEWPVTVDDRSLSTAVNGVIEDSTPCAVVMADLGIVTPVALERLFSARGDVVMAPGRTGGTNALVVRDPAFRVDYHGTSYLDHHERARLLEIRVREIDSFRLATDIDEPTDLVELFVHGEGHTRDWLVDSPLVLTETDAGVTIKRTDSSRIVNEEANAVEQSL